MFPFNSLLKDTHCVKSVLIRSYYGPHFPAFGLNTEIRSMSPYSVQMRENVDQNNSEYGHFLRSDTLYACNHIYNGFYTVILKCSY